MCSWLKMVSSELCGEAFMCSEEVAHSFACPAGCLACTHITSNVCTLFAVPAGPPHFTYASSTSVTIPSWSRDQSAESAIQNFHTMHPLPPPHIGSPIRTASGARSTASPNELTAGSVNSILNLHTTDGEVLTPPLTDFPSRHSSVSPPGPGLQQGCSSTSVDSLLDTSQGVAGGDRLHVGSGGQSGGETLRSHLMESAMGGGDNGGALGPDSPWPGIWRLVSVVDSLEPDKQVSPIHRVDGVEMNGCTVYICMYMRIILCIFTCVYLHVSSYSAVCVTSWALSKVSLSKAHLNYSISSIFAHAGVNLIILL